MPGLLDGLTNMSDGDQMGLAMAQGLLSARGGAGFAAGLGNMQETQNGLLKRQLTKAQLAEMNVKTQMDQATLARNQRFMDLVMSGSPQGGQGQAQGTPAQPEMSGGGLGSGSYGMSYGGQPASQPQAQNGGMGGGPLSFRGMPSNISNMAALTMAPSEYMKALIAHNAPSTDQEKYMAALGIDPRSPEGQAALKSGLQKANYVAPSNIRPGGYTQDISGNVRQFPHVPDGFTAVDNGRGGFSVVPATGGLEAIQASAQATASGKAAVEPTVAFSGNRPTFSTKLQDAQRAQGIAPQVAPQPGMQGAFKGDPSAVAASIAEIKDPQERANAQSAFESQMRASNGQLTPQLMPGQNEGAKLSQDELSAKGKSLMADNGQTNTVINRLQNIKMLAPGAIAGAETSRRDFFNGILSLAGIQGATDAKTASDLVDKNSAQIVTALRMGQGGAGTDALQTLLGAANPSRHMTKDAINEAADQLIASQKMIQAKAQMLQPHYLGRDPVSYGQKEMTFDQHADPRIWQLESMNPQQQATYVKSLPPDVAADMLAKRKQLKAIGALK